MQDFSYLSCQHRQKDRTLTVEFFLLTFRGSWHGKSTEFH